MHYIFSAGQAIFLRCFLFRLFVKDPDVCHVYVLPNSKLPSRPYGYTVTLCLSQLLSSSSITIPPWGFSLVRRSSCSHPLPATPFNEAIGVYLAPVDEAVQKHTDVQTYHGNWYIPQPTVFMCSCVHCLDGAIGLKWNICLRTMSWNEALFGRAGTICK